MADKFRVFSGVIYPDSESYDCIKVLETVKIKFKEWAYVLHDRDTDDDGNPKKAHMHWVGRGDPRTVTAVANFLGLACNDIELGKNFKALVQYLIHLNNPEKFQYSIHDVTSNIAELPSLLRNLSEGQLCKDLASAKLRMSWYDLIQYAVENDCFDVLRRNTPLLKLVWEERTKSDDAFIHMRDLD